MVNLITIPSFNDNYIWLIKDSQSQHCIVVDPGDATPVLEMLESQDLILDAIVITHKHYDHIDGVMPLLSALNKEIKIYSKNKLFPQSIEVLEGQTLHFFKGRFSLKVMEVAGHTLDHVVYYNEQMLFCGDTLFSGGCGRVFEGTHQQMFDALSLLANLPDETKVYCAHEYTENNLAFAYALEPKNSALLAYMQQVAKKRQLGLPTIPSNIGLEKTINPFLRCEEAVLVDHLQNRLAMPLNAGVDTFSALRTYKDNF
ncbi:hydroxyacylglutathione hydrolase [Psychromonas sp. Urea-02u-13]|uniref:hydroxyacylglutathione hydrolase n=1 Tax=Psychromonas sp. Urea-02u-13 TaxID=2058326 RepID=UPI000C32AEB5|nr:hydroxyacylglutathione hydrolase [Psychromonas sp. Urea-02u-13]PKG40615.1 hydroxyacylglutathione hydrolase [Psychromonas sp. Urea-02u-13]